MIGRHFSCGGAAVNRRAALGAAAVAVVVAGSATWFWWPGGDGEVQRIPAGPYLVRLDGSVRSGADTVEFDITDRQAAPASPTRVLVEPAMPQMGHAVPPATAEAIGPGRYRAALDLPMSGQWEITVRLSGPSGDGTATFSVRAA
ncbi:FixH family protein [Nocardia sp. BMG51109]|uniref:FixH family protein n=1 Tax=Nocardia sp. BMG51109 TaxID=1056816 RepID=UPI0004B8CA03|nr:FixH family protein [Nocardia sp. BMG51109]